MVMTQIAMKEEWRYVTKDTGGQFVTTRGIIEMLKLSVGNLALQYQVCMYIDAIMYDLIFIIIRSHSIQWISLWSWKRTSVP